MAVAGQITITLADDGKLNVQCGGSAVPNKYAAVGLLEMAKTAVLAQQQQPTSPLLIPRGVPLTNGKG